MDRFYFHYYRLDKRNFGSYANDADSRYCRMRKMNGTIIVNENTDDEYILFPIEFDGGHVIACLYREDFDGYGYDSSSLTDGQLSYIAKHMGDVFTSEQYWTDLDYWAEYYGLPHNANYEDARTIV